MNRHTRKRDCKCATCRLFDSESDWYSRTVRRDPCYFCEKRLRDTRENPLESVGYIPLEVREILGVENICWACRNVINSYVKLRLGLCWGKASYLAIELALTMLVRDTLSTYAHKTIWRKSIETRDRNKEVS